ncbi:STM3941 family protein [Flavobacterium sp.]|uniref:STM3941 family protein n=1 Tax=Flavobacterium sp. TaxID=239 RepID=UPI0011F7E030|nr:STM3941 family protein [Flavobacterium sp.]RZJ70739.1 MAG: hypothetical protein EOO49_12870 [Flavobacterium sp.]
MTNQNFIETARHSGQIEKGTRNLMILMGVLAVAMIVSGLFYESHTAVYQYVKSGDLTRRGWPASVLQYSAIFFCVFAFSLYYIRCKQDLKKPALGLTDEGLFINQQTLKNTLVEWDNIEKVEIRGHISSPVLRVFFKDVDALLKKQPFPFKSISKASLKADPSLGISKHECIGDLVRFFDFMKQKGVASEEKMAGRNQ